MPNSATLNGKVNLYASGIQWGPESVLPLLPLIACKNCGTCCSTLHPIRVDGAGARKIADHLGLTVKELICHYRLQSMNMALDSDHPKHIRDMLDYSFPSPCPFRTHHCEIWAVRPVICQEFPLQRWKVPEGLVVAVTVGLCDAGRPCIDKLMEWQR